LLKEGHGGQRRPVEWQDTASHKQYGGIGGQPEGGRDLNSRL
jgi:hypothetical protein